MVLSLKDNLYLSQTNDDFIQILDSSFDTVYKYLNILYNGNSSNDDIKLYDLLSSLIVVLDNIDNLINISDYEYTSIDKDYTLTKYIGDDAVVIVPNVKE